MYRLYDFLLLLVAAALIPYYLFRGLRYGKSRRGIRERLARYTPEQLADLQAQRLIWVHAVSVGETRAAIPLLKGLREKYSEHKILLTNVTETGHKIASESRHVDYCLFFPFDFSWTVKKSLQLLQPELVIIVETEIWPNFSRQVHLQGIPLVLANGRLSDRSFPRYRFFKWLLRPVLRCFSAFCMQSQVDAERIGQLGAELPLISNTGNLKFDHQLRELTGEEILQLKTRYRLPDDLSLLVAGSTHAGEEQQLLAVFKQLIEEGRELALVLIPRHPERAREVQALAAEQQFACRLRSQLDTEQDLLSSGDVLLVDTLGEVMNLYAVADVVFVGGSLVPVGGHNLLEASLQEKPVLFGPHVHNFREISAKLSRSGAGIKVANQSDLLEKCALLLDDRVRSAAMGRAGRALIVENAGATERTLQAIARVFRS